MSRTFTVEGTREVTEYVTWTVEADSFDEARDKVYGGEYRDVAIKDSDVQDDDIDEVTCDECDCTERACACAYEDDEDEYDSDEFDVTVNPEWDSGMSPPDLDDGEWIVPDKYTSQMFAEDEPVKVTSVGSLDGDGEYLIGFERINGTEDYWYVNEAARFSIVDETDEDTLAEAQRKRAEKRRQLAEQSAVYELLHV